jgi:hypothetical protein
VWGNLHFRPDTAGPSLARIAAKRFLLEAFEPSTSGARSSGARLQLAAEELTREGTPVTYRRTIRVTVDETSFHLVDAAGEEAVEAAARRAGIKLIRVVAAEESVAQHDPKGEPA